MNFRKWHGFYWEEMPKEIEKPQATLVELIDESIKRYASKTAVIDGDLTMSYQELQSLSLKFASFLSEKGFRKDDKIALMVPNSAEYIISFLAVLRLGGTIVQVNPMYQSVELEYILKDSEVKWIICETEQLSKLAKLSFVDEITTILTNDKGEKTLLNQLKDEHHSPFPNVESTHEDVAVLQYTGGTTGKPKGVMLTQFNIISNILQSYSFNKVLLEEKEHSLVGSSPLYHAMGMTSMLSCLYIGGAYIAIKRFKVEKIIEIFRFYKPTIFLGSPTMYIAILNYQELKKEDLESLIICQSGSGPMPTEVMRKFEQMAETVIMEGYGLSEATTVTHRNPVKGLRKPGSIGIPLPSTDAKIVDMETGTRELPTGEKGELLVRGPQVMKGYWKKRSETETTLKDGWLRTGDIALMDEDGFFYIVGRKKEMIIAGGFNIYPAEVEDILYQHPAVNEVCVFGIPDPYRGETVKAVIVRKEQIQSIEEEDLKEWCNKIMARYKVPKIIEFRKELPKTNVGKILRRKLIEEERNKVKQ